MSLFNSNAYLPVVIQPHELNLDLMDNIKKAVINKYLHKETSGFMAKKIKVVEDTPMPLAELVNNEIVVHVTCNIDYKYYKVGDIVSGILTITDESDISVVCSDLICRIRSDSGTVSYDNSKYCFIKNGKVYANESTVTVMLKEAQSGTESSFVFLGNIIEK
ncbi:RNA polymerase subunit RPO18 [Pigeonpox virus]|uniref:DNA-directed RNA polymerase 18 kDa subunit n=1 Tax=Pigeonpox virus TaxID=10264 RepID=A0A068EE33_9POXV|nr:RNA polymerase subunit RPO18 [Pigeonpox virus]AID46569.1 RNA polymerase subunit RPO18 [Pigeonpox virus]WCL40010.1 RNA polymerase subunit RPO18 [Pigeonpox virus]